LPFTYCANPQKITSGDRRSDELNASYEAVDFSLQPQIKFGLTGPQGAPAPAAAADGLVNMACRKAVLLAQTASRRPRLRQIRRHASQPTATSLRRRSVLALLLSERQSEDASLTSQTAKFFLSNADNFSLFQVILDSGI
jgi:hypothetical protein